MMRKILYLVMMQVAFMPRAHTAVTGDRPAGDSSLQGTVSSEAEGRMEGVLVSAREVGGITTVTVISDADGKYQFPANRLGSGTYKLGIRATGYDLAEPAEVKVVAGKTAQADVKLIATRDLASQLMNAEWLLSVEKAGKGKEHIAKMDCVGCHSLTRIMTSKHTAESWPAVLERMKTYGPAGEKLAYDPATSPRNSGKSQGPDMEFARFLASINLSTGDKHSFALQTLPRPTGRATRVVITQYDLPIKPFDPHEILVDSDGMVWTTNFQGKYMLKLDVATRKFTEYQIPDIKPGTAGGANGLHTDREGNFWITGLKQSGVYRFDRKTEEFSGWKLPTGDSLYSHAGMVSASKDGTVWAIEQQGISQVYRLDPRTGEFTHYDPFPADMTIIPNKNPKPRDIGYLGGSGLGGGYDDQGRQERPKSQHRLYGSAVDSRGTYYGADIGAGHIVRIDPDTRAVTLFQTPIPDSGPRRVVMDDQDRLWIAEYRAGTVSMFDTRTSEFRDWSLDTPYSGAYDVNIDKHGNVWAGGMHTDYLYRVDTETGELTKFLLPTLNMNIRHMGGVDNRTDPVTVWIGENHGNKITRVEFLE